MRIRIPPISIRFRPASAIHQIQGVDTSTAALVGAPASGAPTEPLLVTSLVDYERQFGTVDDELRRAVRLFFENGGRRAYAFRPQNDIAAELGQLDAVRFALLALPDSGSLGPVDAVTVATAAIELCERRRAFAVLDPPSALPVEDVPGWTGSLDPSRHAAVYVPRLEVAAGEAAASGAVVGVYARTDLERGVWRAPAGTGASVRGTVGAAATLSDSTVATLYQAGVNAILPYSAQLVVWGARTLASADPDWRYVNVSRLALFLEESIREGTQWAVFEPNGEDLWREIRSSVEGFMLQLFRAGAFAASTPEDAYFVRCDRTTMTQDDIDNGRLVIVVGFAPIQPAEFIVVRIG